MDMQTTEQYLASLGVSMGDAHSWIMANVSSPSQIYKTATDFGITSSMLAEIVAPSIPNATANMVEQFFAATVENFDVTKLQSSEEITEDLTANNDDYINTSEHAFHDGYNSGYLNGFYTQKLIEFGRGFDYEVDEVFVSVQLSSRFPIDYDDGFDLGRSAGRADDDYTMYFLSSSNDPRIDETIDLSQLAEASGYLDGYKDGLVKYIDETYYQANPNIGAPLNTDYTAYSPENIEGYLAPYNSGYSEGLADGQVMNSYDHFYYDFSQVEHMAYLFN